MFLCGPLIPDGMPPCHRTFSRHGGQNVMLRVNKLLLSLLQYKVLSVKYIRLVLVLVKCTVYCDHRDNFGLLQGKTCLHHSPYYWPQVVPPIVQFRDRKDQVCCRCKILLKNQFTSNNSLL